MGVPKHHKDSSRTKSSKKYKDEGRRELNKMRNKLREQKKMEKARKKRERRNPCNPT
mgnify:FL=1